jgi:sugar lactone lactonase YvrE
MKVFISYSRRDDAAVRSLVEDLKRARVQVWIDEELGGGDAWWTAILEQIRSCDVFLFALSDKSLYSKPCRAELGYGQALGLPILPVQIGQIGSYHVDPIFTRQLVDYRDPNRNSVIDLVSAVHSHAAQHIELPDPLPEPPPIPYEYLHRLGGSIHDTATVLAPPVQGQMLFELRSALAEEDDEIVLDDIRNLLRALRRRNDVTYPIASEIDTLLGNVPTPSVATTPQELSDRDSVSSADRRTRDADQTNELARTDPGSQPTRPAVADVATAMPTPQANTDAETASAATLSAADTAGTPTEQIPVATTGRAPANLSSQPAGPHAPRHHEPSVPAGLSPADQHPTPPALQRFSKRTKIVVAAAGVAIVIIATVAIVASRPGSPSPVQSQSPSRPSGQIQLPFTTPNLTYSGLNRPAGVAVDTAGSVYVADSGHDRVLRLAAGATNATQLPFTNLSSPHGMAVDAAGSVYVTDWVSGPGSSQVQKLAAGATSSTPLPFTGLDLPTAVAVDTAGNVYVTDHSRVLKLAPGATSPTPLPFTGLEDLTGVAVDATGSVYVADQSRVLVLVPGGNIPAPLPFTGLEDLSGVAVDATGSVYVADYRRVLKVAAGANSPTPLPVSGLGHPVALAVDTAGNVYVTDSDGNRVLKVPAA